MTAANSGHQIALQRSAQPHPVISAVLPLAVSCPAGALGDIAMPGIA